MINFKFLGTFHINFPPFIYLVLKHSVEYLSMLGCQVANEGAAPWVFTLLYVVLELLLTDVALVCVDLLFFFSLQVGDDVVEGASVEVVDDIVELNLKFDSRLNMIIQVIILIIILSMVIKRHTF